MKVRLTFKTPNILRNAIEEAIQEAQLDPRDEEFEDKKDQIEAEIEQACERFVVYGEYTYLEIDTEKKTAKVLEV